MAALPVHARVKEAAVPVVVTAGGRISGELAQAAGTTIKALAPIGGKPLITFMLDALAQMPNVGPLAVVGPPELAPLLKVEYPHACLILEGQTGPENVLRGLHTLRDAIGSGLALVCTSDLPFARADALRALLDSAPDDADIVFPVVSRTDYEARFPNSPNVWTKLSEGEYTGGSCLLVRPSAIERNHALIERVFAARKSQWDMARLLGIGFALRFKMGTLTIAQAEARATVLTGCKCRALMGGDARLSADVDTLADYLWVQEIAK